MKKKGQILSQPFFYIFSIIVIAMILVFGIKMIKDTLNTACKVENANFMNELEKNIDLIYDASPGSSQQCAIVKSYGLSTIKCEIQFPSGIKGICFVDLGEQLDKSKIPFLDLKERLQTLQGEDDSNVFFVAKNDKCDLNKQRLPKLKIKENFCIDSNTQKLAKIRLENIGRRVEISKV